MLSKNDNQNNPLMTSSFKFLKAILNIALFFSGLLWMAFLFILAGIFLGFEGNYGLENIAEDLDLTSKTTKIILVTYILIGYAVIIYIIYILRKLISSFSSGKLFTRFQCAGFRLVGQLIIWLIVLSTIFEFGLRIFLASRFKIKTEFPDFWLILALGAFFMVLGQVFEKARTIREENELTV